MAIITVKSLDKYRNIVGDETIEKIFDEASSLSEKTVVHINSTYQGGGEVENASDLYDKHFEKYPYATELIAYYIFGAKEDNDVYNAIIGKWGKPVDEEPYSALMLEYEYSWNENKKEDEINLYMDYIRKTISFTN